MVSVVWCNWQERVCVDRVHSEGGHVVLMYTTKHVYTAGGVNFTGEQPLHQI